jgi:cysteine desulfurase
VARILGRSSREVLFVSSGSEACAMAVLGAGLGGSLVTSALEHPAVLLAAERRPGSVILLAPERDGRVTESAFVEALSQAGIGLCALQAANNETGVVQPASSVAALARARDIPCFVDAVQGPGRIEPGFDADLVAYSAHKFGGPAGVGMLVVRRGLTLQPLVPGHQEGGRRGGTPPVVLCEAAALALELAERTRQAETVRQERLRDGLEQAVRERIPGVRVNGAEAARLCNTSNICFPGVDGEAVLIGLDLEGFAVSLGAACASGTMRPSPVLLAMGLTESEARGSLRISFGRETTAADLSMLVDALARRVL